MSWRALLAAFFAAPSLPIHGKVDEAIRSRREASRLSARVHRAAQTSALDLIDRQTGTGAPPMDAIEAMLRGEPRD